MNKLLFLLYSVLPIVTLAQVGINTDNPNATLDVNASATMLTVSDGIIAPKLTGDQLKAKDNVYSFDQTGAIVYITQNLTTEASSKTIKVKNIGYYYFDGEIWQAINSTKQLNDWFYMPSFNLNMSSKGQKSINLYEVYSSQFSQGSNNRFFSSNNTTTIISNLEQPIFQAKELEYIVTFYDEQYITINSIDAEGLMTYTVNNINPPANSFINIVLKPLK